MTDSQELKPGDTKSFTIAGKELVVEPQPFGRLKKLGKIIQDALATMSDKTVSPAVAVGMAMEKHFDQVFPLMFNPAKHEFMTQEWRDDNLTVPVITEIFKAFMQVNGLKGFFGGAAPAASIPAAAPLAEKDVLG